MKILLNVLYYEPAWGYGGPPRMVFELARRLVERGHDVTVCSTDALDEKHRIEKLEEVSHGVKIVRFRNLSNDLAYRLKIFLPVGMQRWLDANVSQFDVVHLFDTRTMPNAWAALAATRANVPFFLSVWGSLPRGEGWRAAIKARFDRQYGAVLYGRAAGLLAQNRHEASLYLENGAPERRVTLWPLAVDTIPSDKLPARGQFRQKLGIAPDAQVVLFVGRLHELKGLEPLVVAFAKVAATNAKAQLVIVGRDDGFEARIKTLVNEHGLTDRVHLPGALYGDEVLPAYVDCDLFSITPTHFEETSLASLSASAIGRPVLINDRCEIPWLDDYDAGVCVPHDVDRIATTMTSLLADPKRLATMGANAVRMVDERFTWPSVVSQIETHYARARASR